jgi:hypothetical protein
MKQVNPLLLLVISLFGAATSFGQTKKDTVYFDEDWSICEKPAAIFYRIGEINKVNEVFYKGDVSDYYIDGRLEMTGHYADNGDKDGAFIFYDGEGNIIKKLNYRDNEMNGKCYFYNSAGNLVVVLDCNSSEDFTPLLVVNKNGDTLLKDSNGKFSFDTRDDLPGIFSPAEHYIIEGDIVNGKKEGGYKYFYVKGAKPACTEMYKAGKFIKTNWGGFTEKQPAHVLHISNINLNKIESFFHSNLVFGFGRDADQKVIDFLINRTIPVINANSPSFYKNDSILFTIVQKVLQASVVNNGDSDEVIKVDPSNPLEVYYSCYVLKNAMHPVRDIHGDLTFTVGKDGSVLNSAYSATLTKKEISKINYYLSAISGMAASENNGEKTIANINLRLKTIIDTFSNGNISVMYLLYNADSTDLKQVNAIHELNDYVDVRPSFPGGPDAWRMYLERNLNAMTPADNGAPFGKYAVTVSFSIDENGIISDVRALNDPGYGTAQEAVRVIIHMPKWIPATRKGKNVPYHERQNITFQVTNQ